MKKKEETISQDIQNKVEALGSDMIMHDVHKDTVNLQEMREAIDNVKAESDADTVNAAVTGGVNPAQFMYRKTRPMVRNYNVRPNDQCPCGSGKKFKNCCKDSGKYDGYHTV